MRNNQKNIEEAKQAARRIYKRINFSGNNLQTYQLSQLLQQTYDYLKISFKPSQNDLNEYRRILDSNGDGVVSLNDFQDMAVKYLCGEGIPINGQNISNATVKVKQNYYYQTNQSFSQFRQNYKQKQSTQYSPEYPQTSSTDYINITGKIFQKYSDKRSNTITRNNVAPLLKQTYTALGKKGYNPSQQDVNVWMKLCDSNADGRVQEGEYEYFVKRTLERFELKGNQERKY